MANEHYGPADFLSLSLSSLELTALRADTANHMIMVSHEWELHHWDWSDELSKINKKFTSDQELIRNKMRSLEDKTSNEYFDLLTELEKLSSEHDSIVEEMEREENRAEEHKEQLVSQDENTIQACDAALESINNEKNEHAKGN